MVLDKYRKEVDFTLTSVAKSMQNVNPNAVSWLGLVIAFVSGILLYFSYGHHWLLLFASFFVILSGYFDALDGKIAKLTGKCSAKGDFLDHVFDRYADTFMIGAIALSGWCSDIAGIFAIIGVLLTSYMGTQAQAIGAKRLYGGLLGRADRIMLCFLFPIIQFTACALNHVGIDIGNYSVSWMEIMMIWFAAVGNLTATQRAIIIWHDLGETERKG